MKFYSNIVTSEKKFAIISVQTLDMILVIFKVNHSKLEKQTVIKKLIFYRLRLGNPPVGTLERMFPR